MRGPMPLPQDGEAWTKRKKNEKKIFANVGRRDEK